MDFSIGRYLAIASCIACMVIAYYKGRRIILWGVLGYFFSFVALVILLIRDQLPRKEYLILERLQQRKRSREIRKEFEGQEPAKDFLKEINDEKKNEN